MPRRPLARRRSLKCQTLAFSPFMRSLALAKLASTSRSKCPHPEAGKSSEKKPHDKEFCKSSTKRKNEQLLESSDEEDPQVVVQADFEFFDPKVKDFHGVKILLQNYLDDKEWDLCGFVDLILGQTTVGTVVKVADDEDDGLFAIVSVLNLGRYKDNKSIQELKDFFLKVCPGKNITTGLKSLLEEKARDVGLLVSQRVLNLPPQLFPPLYEGLFDEVSWATEDEPTEELRSSFRFKTYLLVTKIYKLKNAEKRKKPQSKDDEETIFVKPEDEIFLELRNYRLTGLVMAVEANKIPEFRQKLKSFFGGP